jgi:tRNA 2-thiocytidine biosynthesis protein TtcA
LGATKIALGHRDDIVETLSLNLFYTGKLKTMPPKLRSKDGRHLIIRPLAAVRENDLARYVELRAFPVIPCDLCGSQEDLKWKEVKKFLRESEQRSPGCTDSIFAALSNVAPPLLLDRRLFDFVGLPRIRPDGRGGRRLVGSRPYPTLLILISLPNRYAISDI